MTMLIREGTLEEAIKWWLVLLSLHVVRRLNPWQGALEIKKFNLSG